MNPQILTEDETHTVSAVDLSPAVGHPGPTAMEILILFARKKWLIAKVAAIATVIGIITSLLWPIRYTATTEIMTPQQTESAAMMMSQLATTAAGSMAALATTELGLKNPNETYIGMLGSRPIADALIRQFDLLKLYRAKDMTAARKTLDSYTKITSEKSGFIAISITDKDKFRAADIANAYVEQLRNLTQTMAASEASQRRSFYEGQLKEAKDDLVAAEASFQRVQQTKGVIQPADQAKVIIESLASLRAGITAKKVELQALRSYSTDSNPQVQLTENELASMEAAEARMEQKQHSGGFSNLGLGDVPGAGLDYLNAQHELLYRQTLFDLLIKQYDAAKLDESKEATIIHVVTPAIPPDRKSSPHRGIIVLLFMLVGLLGSCSYIYSCNFLERSPTAEQSIARLQSALRGR